MTGVLGVLYVLVMLGFLGFMISLSLRFVKAVEKISEWEKYSWMNKHVS